MNRISHWIDGKVVAGTSGRDGAVFNPATGEQTAAVDFASVAGGRVLRQGALARAKQRHASAQIDGWRWYWPADENPASRRHAPAEQGRLRAPRDPPVRARRPRAPAPRAWRRYQA